ncbi:CHASE2 domain-containing protein [Stappia sp. F7233]|uniref:CHASE2 domain-containing protein n=1 Tax=Stappia albiluteola TaxID=2758565 RepID=A0A839AJV5_9HYPH|nr:adenylate/guanylate cyclase domain-containing protein [Stappia albiluteola]MBA5778759.1 CHASE2 domain-containing protein [Stappia albiluteola]
MTAVQSAAQFQRKLLIALTACAAGIAAGYLSIGAIFEGGFTDRLLQARAALVNDRAQVRKPVAVVGLDMKALTSDRLKHIPRVFMTGALAEAGDILLDAGAKGIGFDFVFAFSTDDFIDPQTGEARLRGYDRGFLQFLYQNRGRAFVARTHSSEPHRRIAAAIGADGVKSTEVLTDSDGIVRRHAPAADLAASPSFQDALLALGGGKAVAPYRSLPTRRVQSDIPYLSLVDLIQCADTEEGRMALRDFAEDRVILFGSTMPNEDAHLYTDRYLDRAPPPSGAPCAGQAAPRGSSTSGVFVLADLVGAPLTGDIATDAGPLAVLVLIALFATAGAAAGLATQAALLPVAALGIVAAGFLPPLAALGFGIALPSVAAAASGSVALVIAGLAKIGLLTRRERQLMRLFAHYLSPHVIKKMADQESLPGLGGEKRAVTVAFIDIIGFTKLAERLSDHEVVAVVNDCFDGIGEAIIESEGFIDKYIGDAIMAVWNAPNDVAEPERRAVEAARRIIAMVPELRRRTGVATLDLRVALHSGEALVGHIGGRSRRSFTVMGTTVNIAARIEEIASERGIHLAMSQPVADAMGDEAGLAAVWRGQMRGLSQETAVYTLKTQGEAFDDAAAEDDLPANVIALNRHGRDSG